MQTDTKSKWKGQLRHVLTGLAGVALAKAASKQGLPTDLAPGAAEAGIGIVLYGVGAIWSWVAKRRAT